MSKDEKIRVFSEELVSDRRSPSGKKKVSKVHEIPVDAFAEEAQSFYSNMVKVFGKLDNKGSKFKLDEIVINAEVSGSGTLGFLGTGVTAGIKGSVQFKLKLNK